MSMRPITGEEKTIQEILSGVRYAIDDYQREYIWLEKQIDDLVQDLTRKFHSSYQAEDDLKDVANYKHYFLGSIIVSEKEGRKFIIDGQQRLTSITLLLILLRNRLLKEDKYKGINFDSLIESDHFGDKSFNLDIEERKRCMRALCNDDKGYKNSDQSESVQNLWDRYQYLDKTLDGTLKLTSDDLPYFIYWLLNRVYIVKISTESDDDAYAIFESMNDRGKSLTPTEMLKGYLLNKIPDDDLRKEARGTWRERVEALQQVGGKDADDEAIKAWLRSQYAKNITIRDEEGSTQPGDFYLIGSGFHRWVSSKKEKRLGLKVKTDFVRFIQEDFDFYIRQYEKIRKATIDLTPKFEAIHYNAWNKFTLQYPVLLAPLQRTDSEDEINRKLRIVANYLDILIARRIWNGKNITHSTMLFELFDPTILGIRSKPITKLVEILIKHLGNEKETFATNPHFGKHRRNGRQIHQLLARMLDYIETNSGRKSRYLEYIQRSGQNGYEIEHIWANKHERHADEFPQRIDFEEYRDRIGGLLLLPKKFNASYGERPYADKYDYYYGQNLLAQSLHEKTYNHDTGFSDFRDKSGLNFDFHIEFKKADLDARQELYRNIAEQVWNPENLLLELEN